MSQRTLVGAGVALLVLVLPEPMVAAAPDGPGPWMDRVVSVRQGATFDALAVVAARSVLSSALGPADSTDEHPSFLSLGFGGTVTLASDAPICNGPGADLRIIEVTQSRSDSDERAAIDVSPDGTAWTRVAGSLARSGDVGLPSDLPSVRFVRVTDVTPLGQLARLGADGYDLDAVGALQPASACGTAAPGTTTSAASTDPPPAGATTPVATPEPGGSPGVAAPTAATQQVLACGEGRLLIQDVARTGARVRVVGVADPSLVGRRIDVHIADGGPLLGSAVVAADGTFALTSRPARFGPSTRVVAVIGKVAAQPVRVTRRLLTRSVATRGGLIRWTGRLTGTLPTGGATVALSRRVACGRYRVVARVRARRSGGFLLSVPAPRTGSYVYRLTSVVAAPGQPARRIATFSTPRGLTFGG